MSKDTTELIVGHDLKLTCAVTGFPVPTVRWYKNNTPLPKSDRISVSGEDNALVINKVSTIDAGVYSCRYAHPLVNFGLSS